MPPNAWTGSAWGKAAAAAEDEPDYEGEDACGVCLNAPEAVSLQPCKHKICAGCVDRLRYQLISKASAACLAECNAATPAHAAALQNAHARLIPHATFAQYLR